MKVNKEKSDQTECPIDEMFKAFAEDTLDAKLEENIRGHIEKCDSCRDRFLGLV